MTNKKNFYVIYGSEGLKDRIQNELEKLIQKLNIEDVIKYNLDSDNLLDAIEDATTFSMFSTQKVIVLENCFFLSAKKTIDNVDKLEQYIQNYNPDTYCILTAPIEKMDSKKNICKLLNETAQIIELKEGKNKDNTYLINYVKEFLEKEHYQIESIPYLLTKTGSNLNNIQNELDKLLIYKQEEKIITNQDIDKITVSTLDEEDFALTNAIIAKNLPRSLQLLEQTLKKRESKENEMSIIGKLASQFRFLLQVKILVNKNKSKEEIANILGAKVARINYTMNTLYYYTEPMLKDAIQQIAKMDHDIKLGIMDKRLALELFIMKNCSKQ